MEFALRARMPDGETYRDHLLSAWRQSGEAADIPAELNLPRLSPLAGHLWASFDEISAGVAPTGMGPPSITWEALHAWQIVTASTLEPWQRKALFKINTEYLIAFNKANAAKAGE